MNFKQQAVSGLIGLYALIVSCGPGSNGPPPYRLIDKQLPVTPSPTVAPSPTAAPTPTISQPKMTVKGLDDVVDGVPCEVLDSSLIRFTVIGDSTVRYQVDMNVSCKGQLVLASYPFMEEPGRDILGRMAKGQTVFLPQGELKKLAATPKPFY